LPPFINGIKCSTVENPLDSAFFACGNCHEKHANDFEKPIDKSKIVMYNSIENQMMARQTGET
jgi:cytochrome c553